jgi:maleate isomerase
MDVRVEGSTRAVGVIVPHDMALDRELWRWTPDDVSLLFTRTPHAASELTVDTVSQMGDPEMIASSALDLATVSCDCYAYACTSGSFIQGRAGEQAIVDATVTATGTPAVTTSGCLVAATAELGLSHVAVANPYATGISEAFRRYLIEHQIGVASVCNAGFTNHVWQIDYRTTAGLIRQADHSDAEAILVCCTNLATYDLIAELERELGKPVITANQATMWAAMRLVGREPVGAGQRLINHRVEDDELTTIQ